MIPCHPSASPIAQVKTLFCTAIDWCPLKNYRCKKKKKQKTSQKCHQPVVGSYWFGSKLSPIPIPQVLTLNSQGYSTINGCTPAPPNTRQMDTMWSWKTVCDGKSTRFFRSVNSTGHGFHSFARD